MAEVTEKFADNVAGRFYIDASCIVCGACEGTAPDNIRLSDDGSHDVVYKQPENEAEEQAIQEAIEGCPVGAIGEDGE
ncbi:MAG TPA: ferredoxin [Stenomitos sp.]